MPSQTEIQKQITDRIIEGLKTGNIPWRKPWRPDKNSGSPDQRHFPSPLFRRQSDSA